MSNGGILSHRLACELADRIAAIAPVAGTDLTSTCNPTRPIAVMHTHGTADGHVPWDGGEGCGPTEGVSFTSVPETVERWRTRNGCSAEKSVSLTLGDGQCETYEACAAGADVTLCAIQEGGHNWPGGRPPAGLVDCPGNGGQSTSFHASVVIWSFLSAHPMRAQ
jgi:polyhydroxybutyrate depolymerase